MLLIIFFQMMDDMVPQIQANNMTLLTLEIFQNDPEHQVANLVVCIESKMMHTLSMANISGYIGSLIGCI